MPDKWEQYAQPASTDHWDQYAVQPAKPEAKPTPVTLEAQKKAGLTPSTIGPRPKGIGSWLESLESDIRSGGGATLPGRLLQEAGAPGLEKGGGSKDAAEFMASPLLGTVHAAQGVSMLGSHPWEGTKRTVSGVAEAATIPGLIEMAPSEAGAATMGKLETLVKDASAARKVNKTLAEWRNINKALKLSPKAVTIGEGAESLAEAGKMPGRTLEQLGFDSKRLSRMTPMQQLQSIKPHLENTGKAIESALDAQEKAGKTLDVGARAFETFKKIPNPNLQQAAIDTFNDLAKEVGITNQRAATPKQAWQLRRALVAGARFGQGGDLNSLGTIRDALRGSVSSDLKDAVPELKVLDQRYSDLKEAVTGARNAIRKEAVNPKEGLLRSMAKGAKREITERPIRTVAGALGVPYIGYEAAKHFSSPVPGR